MPASTNKRKVTFEKLSEDENGATYHVEAIHVTTTGNNRKYTKEELVLAGRSLSFRPININHDESRFLPYDYANPTGPNSNTTLVMDFDPAKNGVVGDVWITDKATREALDSDKIKTVSIEQVPTKGEACSCMIDKCTCEQLGIVFTAIGLLETFRGVQPGDSSAKISKESIHDDMGDCMDEMKRAHPDMEHDQMVAICLKKTGQSKEDAYPWDKCIADQKSKGYDDETAKKICGSIKAANELKKGCNCETRKAMIDEFAKLERFRITGKVE